MAKVMALVAVVLLASCSGKKAEKDRDAGIVGGAHGGGGGGGAPPEKAPAPPAKDRMLTCDQAIAKDFHDKYLASLTLKELKVETPMTANCKYEATDKSDPHSLGVSITIQCLDSAKTAMAETIAYLKKQYPEMKDATGIGTAALVRVIPAISKHVQGATMIVAFDDDSNCKVDVTASAELDATALTKDLLASLPPK